MWIETRLLSSATCASTSRGVMRASSTLRSGIRWDRLEHAESVHSRELQQYNSNMRAWLSKQSAVVALSLSVRVCWLTLSGKELRAAVGTLDGSAPPYLRSAFVGIRSLSDAHAAFEVASAGEEDSEELLARGVASDRVWRFEIGSAAIALLRCVSWL
mmetsp:Transcript_41976/g.103533  ORF Transcript_41976/g.103533 Transcript_41976/m.103533 type:complete len:158 (+) Transcript_41976:464-937(+)